MTDWLFGYGSLIWRPGFEPDASVYGSVFGKQRRFYQGSPDHRGTDARPGRVVTLLPANDDATVFGVALKIPRDKRDAIVERLEVREQAGYERVQVRLHPNGGAPPIDAFTFVATERNPNFLGPRPVAKMAETIASAHGQSGPNREYLLKLQAALHSHGVFDAHVDTLVDALREHEAATHP